MVMFDALNGALLALSSCLMYNKMCFYARMKSCDSLGDRDSSLACMQKCSNSKYFCVYVEFSTHPLDKYYF